MYEKIKSSKTFVEIFEKSLLPAKVHSFFAGRGLARNLYSVLLAQEHLQEAVFMICASEHTAHRLIEDLLLSKIPVSYLPPWTSLLYQNVSSSNAILAERSLSLHKMAIGLPGIYVIPLESLFIPSPAPKDLKDNLLLLKEGQKNARNTTLTWLSEYMYQRKPHIEALGDYSVRGSVIDIYTVPYPLRLDFNFDDLERLQKLDPLLFHTQERQKEAYLFPQREHRWTDEAKEYLRKKLAILTDQQSTAFLEKIIQKNEARSEELFYPLFWKGNSVFDFIHEKSLVLCFDEDQWNEKLNKHSQQWEKLYQIYHEQFPFMPKPHEVFFEPTYIKAKLKNQNHIRWTSLPHPHNTFNGILEDERNFRGHLQETKKHLHEWKIAGFDVRIFCQSSAQQQRLDHLFRDEDIQSFVLKTSSSLIDEQSGLAWICEKDIFGHRHRLSQHEELVTKSLESFTELELDDYVVHLHHGIGRFKGLKRLSTNHVERDYIVLEYADAERIMVPLEQLELVQRYLHKDGHATLDRIGGKAWQKRKERAKKRANDIADRLLALHAQRELSTGIVFEKDNQWQLAFEAAFPFEETPDQKQAIEEIKRDMESPRPMDRLLCGDVGFGKTEVALRAAFKAVLSGRQVAILAPTTILVEQHFQTLSKRIKNFPIEVAMLSRFVSQTEQKKTIQALREGHCDIVVGTHRLLSQDIEFNSLGLLIIDEEQRFGVSAKEKLKEFRHQLDVLTLSATPIPRTLHMSLSQLRSISLLRTPPSNRQAIETYVEPFNEALIQRAIRFEIERGGQVFFLHNRIETLASTQVFLERLLPELFISMAHGQMPVKELEDVIHRFSQQNSHILLSTSIIENGIDMPNVNTIIIDRADQYGLSQLYQIRGRVGRSSEKAYAYLFYPPELALSEQALRRLRSIAEYTQLGSGFKVAMRDLELRGVGNLLGEEQHGELDSVGLELYLQLLESAIAEKRHEAPEKRQCFLDLSYSGFIPADYIENDRDKMDLYKRIAKVSTAEELWELKSQIIQRYGAIPDELENLFSLAELRLICNELKLASLVEKNQVLTGRFYSAQDIPFDKFLLFLENNKEDLILYSEDSSAWSLKIHRFSHQRKIVLIRDALESLLP